MVALGLAGPAEAATLKQIAGGLNGAIGTALDETNHRLYFVEYNTGQLKYLGLNPALRRALGPGPMCVVHSRCAPGGFHTLRDCRPRLGGRPWRT